MDKLTNIYNKNYNHAKVYNSYGPTEATIASNYTEITDVDNITIGKALPNYVTEVRDIDGKFLPEGVISELYIGGVGVGKGYYNMPDKTSEAFLTIDGIPYYRSGDYALETVDGEIEIKGRIDNQIKLRGLRIEIGEIESNIANYPGIKQVAVVIKKISDNDHLCAYFTAEQEIDAEELKQYLKDKLTEYMIPTVFMQLDVMPVLPNGKTDTKALPEIDEQSLKVEYMAPTTPAEEIIVKAFEAVFNQKIGIHDDFTALGGDSLTSIKVTSLLASYNITLSPSVVLNSKTPEKIAKILEEEFKYQVTLARKGTTDQNMFLIPPLSGTSLAYSTFIPRLEFEGNIYVGDDFKYLLSLEEMQKTDSSTAVEQYYQAILDVFQDGDIIAAYSQGCMFAVMITSMLEKVRKVGKCILIDGDLEFKETEPVNKEEALGLVMTVISSRFDFDESAIQLDQLSSEQLSELIPEEFAAMIPGELDVFVQKIIVISIINSVWDFEPVSLDSHVVYLSTEPKYEDFSKYAHDFEYISVEAEHLKLMDEHADRILKYVK